MERPPLYPVALDIAGKLCLVVGGGAVAYRKAQGLLLAGARVAVVAPRVCAEVGRLVSSEQVWLEKRRFRKEDVEGMALVFAATDSPEVNASVVAKARAAGILSNRADLAADCDFTGMGAVTRGSLVIAITTGAESPAFARWIREQVEESFGPEYSDLLGLLSGLREEVKQSLPPEERSRAWERALRSSALEKIREGDTPGALATLRRELGLK